MDYYGPTQNDFIFTLFCPFIMPFFSFGLYAACDLSNLIALKKMERLAQL